MNTGGYKYGLLILTSLYCCFLGKTFRCHNAFVGREFSFLPLLSLCHHFRKRSVVIEEEGFS